MTPPVTISAAVEGIVDEAVARRLIESVGAEPGPVHGKCGKDRLRQQVRGYNGAARHSPWLLLVDLDQDHCAATLRSTWVPNPAPSLCFRVVIRQVEAWLLSDPETLASFLRVGRAQVPAQPETLDHPKVIMVNLARRSRSRDIRRDMVPREASGRTVGPAYTSRVIEYTERGWRPDVAARNADSLARSLACLRRLVAGR